MMNTRTSDDPSKSFFDSALQQYQFMVQTLSEDESRRWDHGEIEQWLQKTGTELLRILYQCHLDLREQTAKAAKKAGKQTKMRLGPGEKKHRKRMATVGSVYSITRHPRTAESIMAEKSGTISSAPKPKNKRVWASVKKESKEVIEDVFCEAQSRDNQNRYDHLLGKYFFKR